MPNFPDSLTPGTKPSAGIPNLFHDSVSTGTPASLGPNAVIGCIRWDKKLGVPNGDIADAFSVVPVHYMLVKKNLDTGSDIMEEPMPALVTKIMGAEDPTYFRLLFFTVAIANDDVKNGELPKDNHLNTMRVAVKDATVWPNNSVTGPGHKIVEPSVLDFESEPHNPQVLPDFTVVHNRD
jgi:hypothetical protein